jgi:Protein of unknown function (DUF1360)
MKPLSDYSPEEPQPLAGYAALTALFSGAAVAFAVGHRRSGRRLPERIPPADFVLLTTATYKLSRLIAKDRVMSFLRAPFTRYEGESDRPSEVSEQPRGRGVRRSIGQLLACPYCLSQWIGAGFLATYLRDPRLARTASALFTIVAGSDLLQEAWVAVDKRA